MIDADYSQTDRVFKLEYTVSSSTYADITSKTYAAFEFTVAADCGLVTASELYYGSSPSIDYGETYARTLPEANSIAGCAIEYSCYAPPENSENLCGFITIDQSTREFRVEATADEWKASGLSGLFLIEFKATAFNSDEYSYEPTSLYVIDPCETATVSLSYDTTPVDVVVGNGAVSRTIVATDSVSLELGNQDGVSYCGFTYEFICGECLNSQVVGNQGTVDNIKEDELTTEKYYEDRPVTVYATKGDITLNPVTAYIRVQFGNSCEAATLTTPSTSYFADNSIYTGPTETELPWTSEEDLVEIDSWLDCGTYTF